MGRVLMIPLTSKGSAEPGLEEEGGQGMVGMEIAVVVVLFGLFYYFIFLLLFPVDNYKRQLS